MYKNWFELLGAVIVEGQIYSSRLQDMLLSVLPDLIKVTNKTSLG